MSEPVINRVGLGTDIHRLLPGGPLRIGGIDIEFDGHLSGHSDADVVLHALTDAILGAGGHADIGERFPDNDPRFKGADSAKLLTKVIGELPARKLSVASADIVIQAEHPRLGSHKESIRLKIAGLLGISADRVAVKAKTNEGLDAIGRGEAISCIAIVGLTASPH